MVVKEKFHIDVVKFEVDGISMIGNNRTGALIGLNEDGKKFVEKIYDLNEVEVPKGLEQLYEALKIGNFFDDMEKDNNRIMSAYLHVTDNCNLHCIGCYSYVEERNKKKDLAYEDICYELDELAANGVKIIVISGGEPFIRKDIASICEYAKNLGMVVQIITNGTMPHERYLKTLPYIDAISVSVDGYNEAVYFIRDKGIMPKVLDTIRFLKENNAKVNLIFTLHRKNAPYMEKYVKMAEGMGVTFNFSMLTASPYDRVFADYTLRKEELEMVENFLKYNKVKITDSAMEGESLSCKSRCGAGKLLVSVAADGTVYPCHMLHVDDLKLGNIMEKDLKSTVFNKDNPFLDLDIKQVEGCEDCKYGNFCGGGCRARSYLATGSIYAKADICEVSYNTLDNKFNNLKKAYGL